MLHCICCDMTAPRQRGHKHNPRSNLFGSFIVGHNSYPRISRDGRLYLVSSRGCGNAALVQHTAHGVSGLKEYNRDCVALVQQFSTRSPVQTVQTVQTPAHFTALQLVNCSPSLLSSPSQVRIQGWSRHWASHLSHAGIYSIHREYIHRLNWSPILILMICRECASAGIPGYHRPASTAAGQRAPARLYGPRKVIPFIFTNVIPYLLSYAETLLKPQTKEAERRERNHKLISCLF